MIALDEYLKLRERPAGRVVMKQTWSDLLFLHAVFEPAEIQKLLPDGLTVDTFPDSSGLEKAWVGLVTFRMSGVRFVGTPSIPGMTAFPEFNVRTYVHREGKRPGVWFFSLDASNPIACKVARAAYSLPYWAATMRCERVGDRVEYGSRRWSDGASVAASCDVGEEIGAATPGSLEFFLAERYLLYAARRGRLLSGQVHHTPYPLFRVGSHECEESLISAIGVEPTGWENVLFCPGVTVDVYGLRS